MATKKKTTPKKNQSSPFLALMFAVLAVSAMVAAYFFHFSPDMPTPEELQIKQGQAEVKPILSPDQIASKVKDFSSSAKASTKPIEFDSYSLIANKEDINSDKKMESVVIRVSKQPVYSELDAYGYSQVIEEMFIYTWEKDEPKLAFSLTEKGIRGEQGQHLIQMAEAHGYGFASDTYTNKKHYKYPVSIYSIILLDKEGKPASDELTIYFKPSEKAYRITNTFEAPGTF